MQFLCDRALHVTDGVSGLSGWGAPSGRATEIREESALGHLPLSKSGPCHTHK